MNQRLIIIMGALGALIILFLTYLTLSYKKQAAYFENYLRTQKAREARHGKKEDTAQINTETEMSVTTDQNGYVKEVNDSPIYN